MAKFSVGEHEFDLTLAVGPASGDDPVQECTSFGSVTAVLDMDRGDTITATAIAGDSPEAAYIDELATDIWLLGDLPRRMRAWAVWQDWRTDGGSLVSMQGVSYERLLNRRLVNASNGLSYNNVDQGEIVWRLWEHTQSLPGGDLGVTLGSPWSTGITRVRNYPMGDNLGKRANALRAGQIEDGLWWGIDHNLQYTAMMPDDFDILLTPLQLGMNCRSMQRASGGSDFSNVVYGDASAEHTTPQIGYITNVGTDPRGRWEEARSWPTVERQDTLNDHILGAVTEAYHPFTHWNIELEPERWVSDSMLLPGMRAILVVPPDLVAPVGEPRPLLSVQVTSVSVNFTNHGKLAINAVVQERSPV